MVQGEGVKPNTAARRVGVTGATAQKWIAQEQRRLDRRGESIENVMTPEAVHHARGQRLALMDPAHHRPEGVTEEKDRRWFYASAAAELLYLLRATRVIGAAEYATLFKRMTNRAYANSPQWREEFRQLTAQRDETREFERHAREAMIVSFGVHVAISELLADR